MTSSTAGEDPFNCPSGSPGRIALLRVKRITRYRFCRTEGSNDKYGKLGSVQAKCFHGFNVCATERARRTIRGDGKGEYTSEVRRRGKSEGHSRLTIEKDRGVATFITYFLANAAVSVVSSHPCSHFGANDPC